MQWTFRRDRAPFEMEKFPRIHSEDSIAVNSWNTWSCGVGRKSSPVQKTACERRLENHRVTINAWVKMDSKVKTESRSLLLNIKYEKNYSPKELLSIQWFAYLFYQLSISSMMIRPEDDPHTSPIVWSQNFKHILEITVSNFRPSSGSHHPFLSVLTSQPLIQCILCREKMLLLGKPWLCFQWAIERHGFF